MTLRRLHLALTLVSGALLMVLALTGVTLAVDALAERADLPPPLAHQTTIADLAAAAARHGTVERLSTTPGGAILVQYSTPRRIARLDPASGTLTAALPPSELLRLVTEIHRTLDARSAGRIAIAIATLIAAVGLIAGVLLLRTRAGACDPGARLHHRLGALAALPLAISMSTGLILAAFALGLIDDGGAQRPAYPQTLSEGERRPLERLAALAAIPADELEELTFPRADDPDDAYRLTTTRIFAYVDPVSGDFAAVRDRSPLDRIHGVVLSLHSGRGFAPAALVLGLGALAVPVLAATGLTQWLVQRRSRRNWASGVGLDDADTVVLVGTQGGTTRHFAERLATALQAAGHRVHVAAMNDVAPTRGRARRLLILTSTHGVGDPPASADRFLDLLAAVPPTLPFAVLGFGEQAAQHYCGFAVAVDGALRRRGEPALLPLRRIHRRSQADFAAWVADLGRVLGTPLTLAPVEPGPAPPAPTAALRLHTLSGPAMGTRWTARLFAPAEADLTTLAGDLAAAVETVEQQMSRFRAGSEILRLDGAPLDQWIDLSPELAAVVACGLDVGRRSNGAFDIALAAEVAALGFGAGWAATPIAAHGPHRPAHTVLDLDPTGRRLRRHAAVALDLAGIAKGFAVDELARVLGAAGVTRFLVGIDGELRAGDARPDGRPWAVGLEAPIVGRRETMGRIDLVDRAVATSGDYRRFAGLGDRHAGHTLDPATGLSAATEFLSVTTLADSCMVADAWATALMVAGRAALPAARAAGVEAILVDRPARTVPAVPRDGVVAHDDSTAASTDPQSTTTGDGRRPVPPA